MIDIAAGLPLPFRQEDVVVNRWSLEVRLNAEDPKTFMPSPGLITLTHAPGGPGIRLDTHIYAGYTVPPYYDSLIAKLLVFGRDREEAIVRFTLMAKVAAGLTHSERRTQEDNIGRTDCDSPLGHEL